MLDMLKNSSKAIGIKQSLKAVEGNRTKTVFIAKDADEKVVGSLKELCVKSAVEIVYVDTMKQLGKACGIEVGASAVCLLEHE